MNKLLSVPNGIQKSFDFFFSFVLSHLLGFFPSLAGLQIPTSIRGAYAKVPGIQTLLGLQKAYDCW